MLFLFPFGLSFFPFLQLLHFTGYLVRFVLLFDVVQGLFKIIQFLAYVAGLFFFSLSLPDGFNGVLYLGIRFPEQLFGIFFGFAQDFFPAALQLCDFRFVTGYGLLHFLFPEVDVLPFVFPIPLVSYDVLQVLVRVDVLFAHQFGSIGYYFLRNTYLAGDFHSERTARIADLQLEQGLHVLAVVEHGSVHYALMVLGEVFQVLVMCRDDAEGLFLVEPFQDGFGYGAADLRFRAASEFVDEQKTGTTASFHHVFHVEQMAGIGTQVVLNALLVPDVDEDAAENAGA